MKPIPPEIHRLIPLAMASGATRAAVIRTTDIAVEKHLAALCHSPKCRNYGLSQSCPPHVPGPEWLARYLNGKTYAVVFRIDLPADILFSPERRQIMRLLHEIAARVEETAVSLGYCDAKAFAGGSCKDIFCQDHLHCNVVSGEGGCRHPRTARPSMSGFGINVSKLMKAAGWPAKIANETDVPDTGAMSWVAGLVVIE